MIDPQAYKEIFEDDRRGAAILEDLTARFARPAVVTGGIDAVLQTYQRDGMRRVIEHIVNQINRASGVPDPNADQGDL
ncbi:hypothetical protein RVU96_16810 [Bordetella avium]|uniref:Bbp19 family protein n=1 Tax=Bordetella avium TaxID=521 RepID=UPI000E09F2E2|nr:hypothetical protein [Bordetella avium]RIQ11575.1 hypothetical protein D0432_16330 [Bordetella avium]RIQ44926.1 hypothetical protein D0845_17110 [Bordetella avium]RIQ49576.1 hypothetical protein D0844_16405 [Bordetella avium]RIQ55327.1 hypothetical protein D0841_16545 [Bordetella avium]RIQ58421.1 hypothetical protein D0842_16500 [Bordetella avium]